MTPKQRVRIQIVLGISFGACFSFPAAYVMVDAFGETQGWWEAGPWAHIVLEQLEKIALGTINATIKLFLFFGFSERAAFISGGLLLLILVILALAVLLRDFWNYVWYAIDSFKKKWR